MEEPRIVIVGAGFGGLNAAQALKDAPAHLVVIDKSNHHLFQPLLYQVATAGLSPADIAAPIRQVLANHKNTEVLLSEITGVDAAAKCVLAGDRSIPYDFLILATGSRHSYFGHPEWEQYAPGLKQLSDATAIRRKILSAFEAAELESDEDERKALLTFILVGAGPTGVEMAGAIAEVAHHALRGEFRHFDPTSTRIVLVEAAPRILLTFPESLAKAAKRALESMGVEVRTGAPVECIDADGAIIGGQRIRSRTIIWSAGVAASPAAKWLGAAADRAGRVIVNPDLTLKDHPEVFVIGDTAQIDSHPLPGVAQVAIQQGKYVAAVIHSRLRGDASPAPFVYDDRGNLATVGRSFAILSRGRLNLSGFPAWVLWLTIHIVYLIGFRNRAIVLFQWAWAYFTSQRGVRLIVEDPK